MSKQILVNSSPYETRVATLSDGEIKELHIEREEDRNVVGNIYKGVVKRVLPGMQAAFLELGLERTAFLYVDDIIDEPFGTDVDWDEGDDDDNDSDSDEDNDGVRDSDDDFDEDGDEHEDESQDLDAPPGADAERTSSKGQGGDNDAPPHFAHQDVNRDQNFLPTEESLLEETGEDTTKDSGRATIDARTKPSSKASDKNTKSGKNREPKEETEALEAKEGSPADSKTEPGKDGDEKAGTKDNQPKDEAGSPESKTESSQSSETDSPENDPQTKESSSHFAEKDDVVIEYFSAPSSMRRVPKTKGAKLRAMESERGRGRGERGGRDDRSSSRDDRNNREERTPDRDDRAKRDDRGDRPNDRTASSDAEGDDRKSSGRGSRGKSNPRARRAARTRGGRGGRRPNRRERRKVDIQELLKEGQEILVQVAKAPIGTKGARLTTHISLPGRNLVLMPTVKHLGISRRIESDRERRRLRDIFTKRIRPEKDVGFIVRTVSAGKTFRELKADAEYLLKVWDKIQDQTKKKKAPALIHEDLSLALKTVRDDFTEDVDSYVIDDSADYERVVDFIAPFSPKLKGRVKLFRGPSQLFEHYGIEAEISRALGKKVWLKSGGYLLVDQSEALTAIDVNTGRYVGSKSLEETILKTNLEAVKEISYQLRVRNIGGIIIMDLIDMESAKNRRIVFDALQKALSEDKARTNILKISELGLVEMTRKRTHEDLVRYLTESCHYCDGRGYHKSRRTIVFEIFREIEKEAVANEMGTIVVFANPEVVKTLETDENKHVGGLEKTFERRILIKPDNNFHVEQFEVFSKP